MTPVDFSFLALDGSPIIGAKLEIQLTNSSVATQSTGVVLLRVIEATTDDTGTVTVPLAPMDEQYLVTVYDPQADTYTPYYFYVPVLTAGQTSVAFKDIVINPKTDNPANPNQPILLVQGDTRPQLVFAITDDKTGIAVNISTATVVMKFRKAGSKIIKATIPCSKLAGLLKSDGTIDYTGGYATPGAGGRAFMDWTPDALDQTGEYEGELETTFADGTVQTVYNVLKFKVRSQY